MYGSLVRTTKEKHWRWWTFGLAEILKEGAGGKTNQRLENKYSTPQIFPDLVYLHCFFFFFCFFLRKRVPVTQRLLKISFRILM